MAIREVQVANVTSSQFAVAWVTTDGAGPPRVVATSGAVRYATSTSDLGQQTGSYAAALSTATTSPLHLVTVARLTPGQTYYFDVVGAGSTGSVVDDNYGQHYQVTLPSVLGDTPPRGQSECV